MSDLTKNVKQRSLQDMFFNFLFSVSKYLDLPMRDYLNFLQRGWYCFRVVWFLFVWLCFLLLFFVWLGFFVGFVFLVFKIRWGTLLIKFCFPPSVADLNAESLLSSDVCLDSCPLLKLWVGDLGLVSWFSVYQTAASEMLLNSNV